MDGGCARDYDVFLRPGRRQGRPPRGRSRPQTASGCTTGRCPTASPSCGRCSTSSAGTAAAGRGGPAGHDRGAAGRGRPRVRASGGLPARPWRCAASPISTRAGPRPTPATRSSSPTPPAPCRTRCAGSTSATKPWPSWRCWSGSTTTWPAKPPGSATGSAACSPASTPPWNAPSARKSHTQPCWNCSPATAARPGYARPAAANSPPPPWPTRPAWAHDLVDAIMTALDEQTVTVPGTAAADTVLPATGRRATRLVLQRAKAAPSRSRRSSMRTLLPRS